MPFRLGRGCAQVCPGCSQGSARDTTQIALQVAKVLLEAFLLDVQK